MRVEKRRLPSRARSWRRVKDKESWMSGGEVVVEVEKIKRMVEMGFELRRRRNS